MAAMKKRMCAQCKKMRAGNRFRNHVGRDGTKTPRKICMSCDPPVRLKNSFAAGDCSQTYSGPIIREYVENGDRVIVLPPSIGEDFLDV